MFHGLLTLVCKPILLWKIFVKKPHNMLFSKKPKYVENHNMYTYLSLHTYTYFLIGYENSPSNWEHESSSDHVLADQLVNKPTYIMFWLFLKKVQKILPHTYYSILFGSFNLALWKSSKLLGPSKRQSLKKKKAIIITFAFSPFWTKIELYAVQFLFSKGQHIDKNIPQM